MSTPDAFYIQMPFGNEILDTQGNVVLDTNNQPVLDCDWADVSEDVLAVSPIVIFQGQRNGNPTDRVGDPGTIKFVMNNSRSNSAGVVGYYSLDHSNVRTGFGLGALVRVGLEWKGSAEWLTQGKIISIKPEPGALGNKRVDVTVGDWFELASRTPMPRVPVQTSVTDDQVLQTIVDALGEDAPFEVDFDPGDYTYNYALTDSDDEITPVMSILQSLALNGLGRIFIVGGATSGEILKYVSLTNLLSVISPVASFVGDFTDAEATREARKRIKRVVASGQPFEVASDATLYTLSAEITIDPGESVEITGVYRDADANSAASIPAVNVTQPSAGTDFNFSSISGSGSDLNASLSIDTFEVGARSFRAVVTNHSGSIGYLWKFDVHGDALLPYQSVDYTAVDNTIAERDAVTLRYDLQYQNIFAVVAEIATALLGWYSVEATDFPFLEYVPTLSDEDMDKFIASKPGEVISATDSVTGVSSIFIVMGREIRIYNGGKYITERLYIAPALQVESGLYFTLDTLGQDDLDGDNTILAYGS